MVVPPALKTYTWVGAPWGAAVLCPDAAAPLPRDADALGDGELISPGAEVAADDDPVDAAFDEVGAEPVDGGVY